MDGRWFQYKDSIFNLTQARRFHTFRVTFRKNQAHETTPYYGDIEASKTKPYVLMLDHEGIDAFKTKPEALQLAKDIIDGKHDL